MWPIACNVVLRGAFICTQCPPSILRFHLPVDITNDMIVHFQCIPSRSLSNKSLHSQEGVQELQFLVSEPKVTNSSNVIGTSSSKFAVTHSVQFSADSTSLLLTRALLLCRHVEKLQCTLEISKRQILNVSIKQKWVSC